MGSHEDQINIFILCFLDNKFVRRAPHVNDGLAWYFGFVDLCFGLIKMLPDLF